MSDRDMRDKRLASEQRLREIIERTKPRPSGQPANLVSDDTGGPEGKRRTIREEE
jgi:hypothetical protein